MAATIAGSPPVSHGHPRLWTRDFTLLLVTNVVLYVSFHLLTPTLPLYVVQLGGDTATAGLMMGLFLCAAVLIRSFAGWALDAYGRKTILLVGVLGFALTSLGYSWAGAIASLLLLRFAHGLSFGVFSVSSGALATDLVPKGRLGEGMGFVGVTWGLSLAIGPAVGLAVTDWGGFDALFVTASGLAFVALALALPLRCPVLEPERHPFSFRSLFEPACLFPSALTLLLTASYSLILTFVSLYALERGVSNVGLFFTIFAAVLTVSRMFTGKLADRLGFTSVVSAGFVLVAASLIVLGFSDHLAGFLVSATLFASGFGAIQPSLLAMAVESLPASRRGAANAAFLSAYDIGIVAGSIGGGVLARQLTLANVYLLGAAPAIVAMVAVLFRSRRDQRPAAPRVTEE